MKKTMMRISQMALTVMICGMLALMLCSCGSNGTPETTVPPTTVPTEPATMPTTVPPTTIPVSSELTSTEIARLAGPATVTVHSDSSIGTGFFIDNQGTLVTCYHVIDGATELSVELNDGGVYQVDSIIDFSELYDIAVLEVSISGNAFLEVCDETAAQGETVYALGASRGLDGTFSNGVISAVNRKVGAITCVQTTAATSGGNSGGPLMNVRGEVVGINAMTRTDGQNLNYAIDISMMKKLSMDKYWNMSEFQEWYDKEINRSYLVYDYDEEHFERSKIHSYQAVTGATCQMSMSYWNPLVDGDIESVRDGYVDNCGIFGYVYDMNEMDQYTDYLKSIGFSYDGTAERRDWYYPGTSFYYSNDFTGIEIVLYVFEDEELVFVEARR